MILSSDWKLYPDSWARLGRAAAALWFTLCRYRAERAMSAWGVVRSGEDKGEDEGPWLPVSTLVL